MTAKERVLLALCIASFTEALHVFIHSVLPEMLRLLLGPRTSLSPRSRLCRLYSVRLKSSLTAYRTRSASPL